MSGISANKTTDITFKIQVKPEVVEKYNNEKIDKLANKYGLDKAELQGGGIGLAEADGMQLNTFKALSDSTGKITKATLIKFDDGSETPAEKASQEMKKVLPSSLFVSSPKTKDAGEVLVVQSKYGNTKDETFTMVGGKDSNKDGKLDVGLEITENDLVKTTNDAVELGGKELKASPDSAMKFFLKKKGVDTSSINVTSAESAPLNTRLGELLNGIDDK